MPVQYFKKLLKSSSQNKKELKQKVFFHRDYTRFQGGHLKVWHYFNHLKTTNNYLPEIYFTKSSIYDASNPWQNQNHLIDWEPDKADILFLAGLDWQAVLEHENFLKKRKKIPVINLIQGLSHADPTDIKYSFLAERAIRICVSEQVSAAIEATNKVNGPIFTLPNAIDLSSLPPALPYLNKDIDLLILAIKKPELGQALYDSLKTDFSVIHIIDKLIPRDQFLFLLNRAKNCLFLPHFQEGFYLPALEGMALGCMVICPDCIGNRGFCRHGETCLSSKYEVEALVKLTREAKLMNNLERESLLARAHSQVTKHSLESERKQFLDIMNNIKDLW